MNIKKKAKQKRLGKSQNNDDEKDLNNYVQGSCPNSKVDNKNVNQTTVEDSIDHAPAARSRRNGVVLTDQERVSLKPLLRKQLCKGSMDEYNLW